MRPVVRVSQGSCIGAFLTRLTPPLVVCFRGQYDKLTTPRQVESIVTTSNGSTSGQMKRDLTALAKNPGYFNFAVVNVRKNALAVLWRERITSQ